MINRRFSFHWLGSGVQQVSCWVDNYPAPIAHIWYQEYESRILLIAHTFTMDVFRRQGHMTWLFEQLIGGYPKLKQVITGSGTPDGGQAWLDKIGFEKDDLWGYVYQVKQVK